MDCSLPIIYNAGQQRRSAIVYQFLSRSDWYFGVCGNLRCTVRETQIPDAPAFIRGMRALFISDVHATSRTGAADIAALAEVLAGVQADIILLGGDYADENEHAVRLLKGLKGLSAPLGVYAVVGNNDREAFEDIADLRRLMGSLGFRLLVNESVTLRMKGGRLIVAGLDEYKYGRPDAAGLYPAEAGDHVYRLLLSHYPRAVEPMPDLMLSGHTHGGQFNALGLNPYTIGFERIVHFRRASRYIAGLHRYKDGWMLVSKGIGASKLPLRIGVAPEVDLIVFE